MDGTSIRDIPLKNIEPPLKKWGLVNFIDNLSHFYRVKKAINPIEINKKAYILAFHF